MANGYGKPLYNKLIENGVIPDWREPNVIRCAPVPLIILLRTYIGSVYFKFAFINFFLGLIFLNTFVALNEKAICK